MVAKKYRIQLKEGWNPEMVWDYLDKSSAYLTLAPPRDIPLTFVPRT